MQQSKWHELLEEIRTVFTGRNSFFDAILPPIIFLLINGLVGFQAAMWSALLLSAAMLFGSDAAAQYCYDGSGRTIGRIDGKYVYDSSGKTIGRMDGNYIYDGSGKTIGRVDGNYYYDGSGRTIGRVDGKYIYDGSGRTIGRVDGNYLYDGSGKTIGRIDGVEERTAILFYYFYFVSGD